MPPFPAFRDAAAHYATLAHEATYLIGHPSRCNRDLQGRFGEKAYAAEELVAELGAAFLCAELELTPEPRPDHAAYVASWLKVLRGDKRAIHASGQGAAGGGLAGAGQGRRGPPQAPPDRLEAERSQFGRRAASRPVAFLYLWFYDVL